MSTLFELRVSKSTVGGANAKKIGRPHLYSRAISDLPKRGFMTKSIFLILALSLCACSKVSPPITAASSSCLCNYHSNEKCADIDAEIDRNTPGCIIPAEYLPHGHEIVSYKEASNEEPGKKRMLETCNAAAGALPSKCRDEKTEFTIRSRGVVCHWECGQSNDPNQPQHGPWKLIDAQNQDGKRASR